MTQEKPDLVRARLPGHPSRSSDESSDVRIFGIIFLISAVVAALIALEINPFKHDAKLRPRMVLHPAPSPLSPAWVFAMCLGILAVKMLLWGKTAPSKSRHKQRDASARNALSWGLWSLVFMLPWNYLAFDSFRTEGNLWWLVSPIMLLLWFFNFLVLSILGNAAYLHLQYRKFGLASCISMPSPAALGGNLQIIFSTERPLGHCRTLHFTLRFVEQVIEWTHTKGPHGDTTSTRHIYTDQVWGQTYAYSDEYFDIPGQKFAHSFCLPGSEELAKLSTSAEHYWELEVKSDSPGVNFAALFPIEVSENPVAALNTGANSTWKGNADGFRWEPATKAVLPTKDEQH